jgi:hypothetical protein
VTHGKSKWFDSLSPGNEPCKPLIRQIPQETQEDAAEELRRLRQENARLRERLASEPSAEESVQPGKCPACGEAITPEVARCPDCQIALR